MPQFSWGPPGVVLPTPLREIFYSLMIFLIPVLSEVNNSANEWPKKLDDSLVPPERLFSSGSDFILKQIHVASLLHGMWAIEGYSCLSEELPRVAGLASYASDARDGSIFAPAILKRSQNLPTNYLPEYFLWPRVHFRWWGLGPVIIWKGRFGATKRWWQCQWQTV